MLSNLVRLGNEPTKSSLKEGKVKQRKTRKTKKTRTPRTKWRERGLRLRAEESGRLRGWDLSTTSRGRGDGRVLIKEICLKQNALGLERRSGARKHATLFHLVAFLAVFILTSAHKSFALSLLPFSFFAGSPCHVWSSAAFDQEMCDPQRCLKRWQNYHAGQGYDLVSPTWISL